MGLQLVAGQAQPRGLPRLDQLAQTLIQRGRLRALRLRQQRRMREVAHRSGEHAQILRGDAGEAFQSERIRRGHDAFGVKQRPIDVEELASGHLAVVGDRGQRVDVFVDHVDVFLELVIRLGPADEAFREFREGEFLTEVGGQEEHQTQSAVDLTAGLERGPGLLLVVFLGVGVLRLGGRAGDGGRGDRGAAGIVRRSVGQHHV